MDIYEFELRYKAYNGLSTVLELDREEQQILWCVPKSSWWALETELVETSVETLREKTLETYTHNKTTLINASTQMVGIIQKPLSEYIERLEYELKVIHEMWYNTYFLIVEDYISRARDHDIVVGPGRWSCAGSLLSYAIWVTDLDPLQYDLIFERFLNPARISMPDIDTDFEDTQRDRVIEYMSHKYGAEKVAHIGTYMTLAAKAAFKDVARVMGVKFVDANKLGNMITESTIPDSIDNNKDLQNAIADDSRLNKIIEYAIALEWTVRQTWVHACGMIIAPEDTHNFSAIQHPPKSGSSSRDESRVVSQYDGGTVENLWLLKMDVLWLRNLSIIKNTIKILNAKAKNDGEALEPMYQKFLDTMLFHPPLDDAYVYKKIFWKWDTTWVFQFESDGMKQWLKKLKPTEFDDLIAMVSLYRPGPMEFIPNYVDRKHEVEAVSYMQLDLESILRRKYSKEVMEEEKEKLITDLWPIMDMTYGIAVYQEQLMRLVQSMAGFSMSEADTVRKWVGKKIQSVIEKVKKDFVAKWETHKWYKPETTMWVYEKMIEPAARYSFNKSHAACYAYISYQTAYLKAHHPIEFQAALLRSAEESPDRLAQFIDEAQMQWYKIDLPDINISFEHVSAIWDKVYLWFSAIKGIGTEVSQHIESERIAKGAYTSLPDFLKRNQDCINKKTIESLSLSGARDQFADRQTLIDNAKNILDWTKSEQAGGQAAGLFAATTVEWSDLTLAPSAPPTKMQLLKTERKVFNTFVSGHPFDGLHSYIRGKYGFISMFKDKESYGEFTFLWYIKSISRNGRWEWFFVKMEDISGDVEFYITNKLDLEPFMIVWVRWYMGRRWRLDQMTVFDLESLITKAKNNSKYKEEETVARIRKERFATQEISKKIPAPPHPLDMPPE